MKYLFLHIPKTGGTALREALLKNFRKDEVAPVYYTEHILERLEKALAEQKPLIYGHIDFGHLEKARGHEDYRLLAFFRHPVERCISTYIHLLHDTHTGRNKEAREMGGFRGFLETPFGNNWVCRYLSGLKDRPDVTVKDEKLYELAAENFHQLHWVGVTERFVDSVISLEEFMEVRLAPRNTNPTRDAKLKKELQQDFTKEILERNQQDLKLWEMANKRLNEELREVRFTGLKRMKHLLKGTGR